jgi:hypothetical protein
MSQVDRNVFVSYSHADAAWLERLKVHLRPLVRRGTLNLWDDTRISPGQAWQAEVAGALAQARVAVLLVSADFLASDFVADNELPALLHRAASGGVLILPLVIGPCLFSEHEELSRYQSVNSPNKPLSLMPSPDAETVLVSLARSVDKYFRLLEASPKQSDQEELQVHPTAKEKPTGRLPTSATQLRDRFAQDRSGLLSYNPLVVDRPINLGFDGATVNEVPIGWFNSFGYVSGVSTEYFIGTSRRSEDPMAGMFAVLSDVDAKPTEFGSLMQRCSGRFLAGKTIRFEGELKSEDVSGWAGLWLRADAEAQPNLFFDNMSRRPVVGTTPWSRYSIDAQLPNNTDWLNYGIVLSGSGHLSADNLRLLQWSDAGRWEDV